MRNPRNKGNEYEKYLSQDGVRVVKGSGSSAEKKGDLKSETHLIQAKRTDKRSFTVKLDDLRKAEKEAMNLGRKPLFIVGFYAENKVTDEWVFMPKRNSPIISPYPKEEE